MTKGLKHVGCHISIRSGYLAAARTAIAIGATAYQYFPKNPRSLSIKTFDQRDAQACAEYCREHHLPSIAHAPYPANLAIESGPKRQAVVESLRNDLMIINACGSVGLVVHFGKYKDSNILEGYRNIIEVLNEVLEGWNGQAKLLIENQAGEGTMMGTTLEELVQIRNLTKYPGHIGFCFDTCHAFASGLWSGDDWSELSGKMKKLGYSDHLYAVHLNDSVYPYRSRRDRHANIGQGQIGVDHLSAFLQSSLVQRLPIILETAAGPDHSHQHEIEYVRKLAESQKLVF